jgi:hypothetical protein
LLRYLLRRVTTLGRRSHNPDSGNRARTYPLSSLAPQITPAGISAPPFSDILASLIASAQSIFGADVSLQPDDADGQLIGVSALAQHNTNDSVIAAHNAYSPQSAIGAGLSSVVKINGLRRSARESPARRLVGGVAGQHLIGRRQAFGVTTRAMMICTQSGR